MAATMYLYAFSKKRNSTATPVSTTPLTAYNITLHDDCSILHPSVRIKATATEASTLFLRNYARIPLFNRYYYVKNIVNETGQTWRVDLDVDPLASFKTQIGAQSVYVHRASAEYDGSIIDTMYPASVDVRCRSYDFNSGIDPLPDFTANCCFVLGLIGKTTGTYYRYFSYAQLKAFLTGIMDDAYFDAVLGVFGATEYPEAKVAVNPLQYITSIRAYPFPVPGDALPTTGIILGPVSIPNATCYTPDSNIVGSTFTIPLTNLGKHPQAAARGNWVNAAMAEYHLEFPGFGIMPLSPSDMATADNLVVRVDIDITTGEALLKVSFSGRMGAVTGEYEQHTAQYSSRLGVNIPLSSVITGEYGPASIVRDVLPGALAAVGAAIAGGPVGAVAAVGAVASSISTAAGNAVKAKIPHTSQVSQQGSIANLQTPSRVSAYYHMLVLDDNADRGRPLLAVRTISNIPGFIQADADSVSIAATDEELTAIRNAFAEGFYYE